MFDINHDHILNIISHLKSERKIMFNIGSLQPIGHKFSFEDPGFIYQCNDQRKKEYWEESWGSELEFAYYLVQDAPGEMLEGLSRAIKAKSILTPGNLTSAEIQKIIAHLKTKGSISINAASTDETGGRHPLLRYFSYQAPSQGQSYPKFSHKFSDLQGVGYWVVQEYESETAFAHFLAQEVDSQVAMGFRVILGS